MSDDSSTPKYLRLTIDVKLGDRKQHATRISSAADAAIGSAVNKLKDDLLDGSIASIQTNVEFSYRWISRSSILALSGATDPDEEL